MSLNCRRLLDQRFLNSIRHNSFAPRLRIAANPCNRALHKKSGNQSNVKKQAVKFTWGERAFKGFSILVIIEVVCLGISYVQWSLMNKDPEYRYSMTKSSIGSMMLEGYYSFGERMDPSNKIREHDLKLWRMQGRNV